MVNIIVTYLQFSLFPFGCTNDHFFNCFQVQVLVENNKNLDLRNALQLVAHVQPIKIEENILHDVSIYSVPIAFAFYFYNLQL